MDISMIRIKQSSSFWLQYCDDMSTFCGYQIDNDDRIESQDCAQHRGDEEWQCYHWHVWVYQRPLLWDDGHLERLTCRRFTFFCKLSDGSLKEICNLPHLTHQLQVLGLSRCSHHLLHHNFPLHLKLISRFWRDFIYYRLPIDSNHHHHHRSWYGWFFSRREHDKKWW